MAQFTAQWVGNQALRGGKWLRRLAAPQGFEPRYADPESAVLPLNEGASERTAPSMKIRRWIRLFNHKCACRVRQPRNHAISALHWCSRSSVAVPGSYRHQAEHTTASRLAPQPVLVRSHLHRTAQRRRPI